MEETLLNLSMQIALVIGLNEVIKRAFLSEAHYKLIPLISLVTGILLSVVLFGGSTVQQGVINGIIVGLSAVGLFSTIKNTAKA